MYKTGVVYFKNFGPPVPKNFTKSSEGGEILTWKLKI